MLSPLVPLHQEHLENKLAQRVAKFEEKCLSVKENIKKVYDAVQKGLKLEDEIFQLIQREFLRFCAEVSQEIRPLAA